MQLRRSQPKRASISLVPMVDVLMILLVFFMVTSTYLDLNMVPLAGAPDAADSRPNDDTGRAAADRLLIRLGQDGRAHLLGQSLGPADLVAVLSDRLAAAPQLDVIVLPSAEASVQALAALMDAAVTAGASRLRIVRLESAQ